MSNGNGSAKWIAIIASIFLAIAGGAYAYTTYVNKELNHRLDKYEQKLDRIIDCQGEIKSDVRLIKWHMGIEETRMGGQ